MERGGKTVKSLAHASDIEALHEIGRHLAAADPLHQVLDRVVEFVSSLVPCDSCFLYVLEGGVLKLRASKHPHPDVVDRLTLRMGQGITGWVAKHIEQIDELLETHSVGWTLDRMPAVDRNILRIGAYELEEETVPAEVAINEAVLLAKRYATDEAARLVNGILGHLSSERAA